jgi:transcriptional regulator with XRE-family HTH domain
LEAERLLIERARQRLSIQELAERSGVNAHTISEMERGVRNPRATTVAKIAEALGLAPEELLGKAPASRPSAEGSPEQRRTENLEELRERYRDLRAGLDPYLAHWETRLAANDLDQKSVNEFLLAAGALFPALLEAVVEELSELALILGIERGAGMRDKLAAEAMMSGAFDRYCDIGRELQQTWRERFASREGAEVIPIDFEKREKLSHRRAG